MVPLVTDTQKSFLLTRLRVLTIAPQPSSKLPPSHPKSGERKTWSGFSAAVSRFLMLTPAASSGDRSATSTDSRGTTPEGASVRKGRGKRERLSRSPGARPQGVTASASSSTEGAAAEGFRNLNRSATAGAVEGGGGLRTPTSVASLQMPQPRPMSPGPFSSDDRRTPTPVGTATGASTPSAGTMPASSSVASIAGAPQRPFPSVLGVASPGKNFDSSLSPQRGGGSQNVSSVPPAVSPERGGDGLPAATTSRAVGGSGNLSWLEQLDGWLSPLADVFIIEDGEKAEGASGTTGGGIVRSASAGTTEGRGSSAGAIADRTVETNKAAAQLLTHKPTNENAFENSAENEKSHAMMTRTDSETHSSSSHAAQAVPLMKVWEVFNDEPNNVEGRGFYNSASGHNQQSVVPDPSPTMGVVMPRLLRDDVSSDEDREQVVGPRGGRGERSGGELCGPDKHVKCG